MAEERIRSKMMKNQSSMESSIGSRRKASRHEHLALLMPPHAFRESFRKYKRNGLRNIRMTGHLNWKEIRHRFERQSTFHGISHAATAPTAKWRWFWYTAFTICLFALLIQIFFIISKYRQYGKTVDLDLKFENAPFPSITICNLNPYKRSAIEGNPSTRAMMEAYTRKIGSGEKFEGVAQSLIASNLRNQVRRSKRKTGSKHRLRDRRYHQAFAQCFCPSQSVSRASHGSCLAISKGKVEFFANSSNIGLSLHSTRCLCQFDITSRTLWPCFPFGKRNFAKNVLIVLVIVQCDFTEEMKKFDDIRDQVDLCLCHKDYNHCVSSRDDGVILEIDPEEDIQNLDVVKRVGAQLSAREQAKATTTTTEAPELTEALGLEELTDDIAITTQAQENIMFAVNEMPEKAKEKMSYDLDELILQCSFNQKDCQMARDFTQHYDNTFGNCYTFNFNRTAEVASHRAGANYGLRVLLYANVSEYLPTTEAIGFRITVHDKFVVPFPDAFGYSAPTGFMSSFGVRMKQFIRLQPPYGHCSHGGEESDHFVYTGFNYSVEACHRSCAQKIIIEKCSCADPMYPIPEKHSDIKVCAAVNMTQRECLRNTTLYLGELYSKGKDVIPDCYCHQPCQETNYEVTYSSARWPSGSAKVMECTPGDNFCLENYRTNAAMVQIFYEELNYETMMESPAYTLTSVLADLGGLTGLWIGASVVSLLEIVSLIVFATQAYVRKRKGSISAQSHHSIPAQHKASRISLNTLHKSSTAQSVKLSVMDIRSIKSIHSNHSSKSKQSILIEDLPPAIMEHDDDDDDEEEEEESSEEGSRTASCRYLAPGEDLPCLCKYNSDGSIRVMKALCPVHGYMVRRNYDYSLSNSEEEDVEDEIHQEEPFYSEPYARKKSSTVRRPRTKSRGEVLDMEAHNDPDIDGEPS
ncbi:unnamed protein product [Caenorhabditis angaria]|uniref:Uncharacterized protein n=1 Tax=Caenorhabditis angaria TaxID=860376 RepID=A0A9P1ID82_9PELO|nr:unnamed protein product [Caenorhabditis angaria]